MPVNVGQMPIDAQVTVQLVAANSGLSARVVSSFCTTAVEVMHEPMRVRGLEFLAIVGGKRSRRGSFTKSRMPSGSGGKSRRSNDIQRMSVGRSASGGRLHAPRLPKS
jgi:hypothetical protein